MDGDNAAPLVGSALQRVAQSERGAEGAKALWQASGLSFPAFVPSFDREDAKRVAEVVTNLGLDEVL